MSEHGDVAVDLVEDVRLLIYRSLAGTGRLPDIAVLVELTGGEARATACIQQLAAARHLALGPDGEIVLAHPFATRSFGFSVMSTDTLWWGGCAWDSFALPHVVRIDDVLVATRCPACDRALAWVVGRTAPPRGDEIAHFLVPAARTWDDVIHSCADQLLFCGHGCVDRWLAATGNVDGDRLDLTTLWHLASHWYDGRPERGYVRRHPATAHEHLRSVGLSGSIWGFEP